MTSVSITGSNNDSNLIFSSNSATITDANAALIDDVNVNSQDLLNNFTLSRKYIGDFDIFTCDSCGNIISDGSSNGRIIHVDYQDNVFGKIIGYSFMGISGESYPRNYNSKNIGYISSYNSLYVYATLRASLSEYTRGAFEEWVISRDGKTIESRYSYIHPPINNSDLSNTSELWVGKFTAIS